MTGPSTARDSSTVGVHRPRPNWQFRYSLRWLLLIVTWTSLGVAWIGCEHRRAQHQTALVNELANFGVIVDLAEPTGVGLLTRKFLPEREAWLREQLGPGWFQRPTVFVSWRLDSDDVAQAAERLKRLGTVQEVQLRGPQSARDIEMLRSELPEAMVVDSQELAQRPTIAPAEQFASEGVGLLALLALALVSTVALLGWPLIVRSK